MIKKAIFLAVLVSVFCEGSFASASPEGLPKKLEAARQWDCPVIKDAQWLQGAFLKSPGTAREGASTRLTLEEYKRGHGDARYRWYIPTPDIKKVPVKGAVAMLGWTENITSNTNPGDPVVLRCYYRGLEGAVFRLSGQYAFNFFLGQTSEGANGYYPSTPQ